MLRIVVVTSQSAGNAARIVHYLVRTLPDDISIVGAVVDMGSGHDRSRQMRRLKAWRAQGGIGYMTWRLWLNLRSKLVSPPPKPRYHLGLAELGARFGFPVIEVPSVNSAECESALQSFDADLGISISNRYIQKKIFSIPRQGMINLHHGNIPLYRGGPPGFWELYNGAATMSVSVHRIDHRLDHGDLLAEAEVPVIAGDDTRMLYQRALGVDYALVADVVSSVARGSVTPIPVDFTRGAVNSIPTARQLSELTRRLGRPISYDGYLGAALAEIPVEEGNRAGGSAEPMEGER